MLLIVHPFEFGRWYVADRSQEPLVVEPGHPVESGELDIDFSFQLLHPLFLVRGQPSVQPCISFALADPFPQRLGRTCPASIEIPLSDN